MNSLITKLNKLESRVRSKDLTGLVQIVEIKDGKYYNEDGSEWVKPDNWDDSGNILVVINHPCLRELYEV